ncbi:MAG TPA: molybdenum cofactor guanylyltransferase [Solirubrobacteraceae bacterium]|nr:molybdenum cofactor guanylyltransferase [Solirubrobacteraceae bacterium]
MGEQSGGDGTGRALVAVLAGGRSTRMGAPKASARLRGRSLISYPLAAAREAGMEALVVAKPDSELPPLDVPVICESQHPRHPLCGIVTALAHAGAPVVAVGCDMPFVSGGLLAWLACAPAKAIELDGRVQPLPAVYHPAELPALERALGEEGSLRATLAALVRRRVGEEALRAFGRPERLCFSVNDARDLQTASRWAAG